MQLSGSCGPFVWSQPRGCRQPPLLSLPLAEVGMRTPPLFPPPPHPAAPFRRPPFTLALSTPPRCRRAGRSRSGTPRRLRASVPPRRHGGQPGARGQRCGEGRQVCVPHGRALHSAAAGTSGQGAGLGRGQRGPGRTVGCGGAGCLPWWWPSEEGCVVAHCRSGKKWGEPRSNALAAVACKDSVQGQAPALQQDAHACTGGCLPPPYMRMH